MKNTKEKGKLKGGFTLIDSMVAMFVVLLGTMTLLSVSTASNKLSKQSEVRSVALQIAKKQLESLRDLAEKNRPLATEQAFNIPPAIKAQFSSQLLLKGNYTVRRYKGQNDMTQIDVTITWKNAVTTTPGRESSIVLSTVIASQPLNISYSGVYEKQVVTTTGGTTGGATTGSTTASTGSTTGSTAGSTTGSTTGGSTNGGSSNGSTTGGGTGGSSTGGATTGEEVGGCSYTYGPC